MTAPVVAPRTPSELADTVRWFAARPELWRPRIRFTTPERFYLRLERTAEHEVWLLTWLPGQGTEIHDHGGASGSFGVVDGTLTEDTFGPTGTARSLNPGESRAFGPRHIHRVTNRGTLPAVSIHAYAPALTTQNYYEADPAGRLRLLRTDAVEE
ncbi:cysteine dioxygenase [Streptomyces sp. NPDC127098]|uniref:cysteine dioxygenase n=1 Tax=Streptomyces sp. NPDC127098 TaxID=3347137 RepID=UPI0036481880